MPLAIRCPRCQQEIKIPAVLAGKKAVCPACNKSFWVPSRAADGATEVAVAGVATPPGVREEGQAAVAVKSAPRGGDLSGVTSAEDPVLAGAEAGAAMPPQLPPVGRPAPYLPPKRVARLVIEEPVPSALVLAPDGQLPSLRLTDQESEDQEENQQQRGVHPLALLAIITVSAVASVALLFWEFGEGNSPESPAKARARYLIEQEYFADLDDPAPRALYQKLLREAKLAYARGDYDRERQLYRQVIELLRQERPRGESLTGSVARDRRLEELLLILLRP